LVLSVYLLFQLTYRQEKRFSQLFQFSLSFLHFLSSSRCSHTVSESMAVKGKVVLVGDHSVGKTSLLLAFQKQSIAGVAPTVNASTISLTTTFEGTAVKLNFWDTAGQEVYRSFVPMFLRGSEVALVVFDVGEPISFDNLPDWVGLLDDLPKGQCQIVVVGNKSDTPQWCVAMQDVTKYCARQKFPNFTTSAKMGAGVQELLAEIAKIVVGKQVDVSEPTTRIEGGPVEQAPKQGRSQCC
jgi:small GTP-binding protein